MSRRYQFTQHYNMTDMSPASFELLHSGVLFSYRFMCRLSPSILWYHMVCVCYRPCDSNSVAATTQDLNLGDVCVADFARPGGSELWDKYHGSPGGLYCTLFNASRSPFPPVYPCIGWPDGALNPDPRWPRGTVPMKDAWIAKLNATNLLA